MIDALEIFTVRAPMDKAFVHATQERRASASVLVALNAEHTVGWGEGAPREYVTGETIDSVVKALSRVELYRLDEAVRWQSFEQGVEDLSAIPWQLWLSCNEEPFQAAACALELASFDLLCRLHDRPLRDVVRHLLPTDLYQPRDDFPVSRVIDLASRMGALWEPPARSESCLKLKMPRDPEQSRRLLECSQGLQQGFARVAVDANGGWSLEALGPLLDSLRRVSWVEEPLAPRAWLDLAELRREGVTVLLDESVVTPADLLRALVLGSCDAVNLRLSKCGGLVATLRLLRLCVAHGLGFQLGVQVGEVGPLWASGRVLAASVRGAWAIEAGRQDEWFGVPLTSPPFLVDRTMERARPLPGPGHGVVPSSHLLTIAQSAPRLQRRTG